SAAADQNLLRAIPDLPVLIVKEQDTIMLIRYEYQPNTRPHGSIATGACNTNQGGDNDSSFHENSLH
ncbi:MAG TPA: hypothetical protein VMF67_18370, partial [Rhizomicrobium sp.]|nr:hypothetical protein [Rhizomicrobium sp.]